MSRITIGFLVRVKDIQDNLNEKGQAAIEFVLVIGFALGITFLFISQSFSATKGYLVHYVNFVGSRVFLTNDRGSRTVNTNYRIAEREARSQIESFSLGDNFDIDMTCRFQSFINVDALFTGSICEFEVETNFFPTMGGGDPAKLVSESLLGKEPTRATCYELTCEGITGTRTDCEGQEESMDITMYDNGC